MTGAVTPDPGHVAGGASRRFFLPGVAAAGELTVRGELAHRMLRVLRLRAGESVEVFDGSGRSWPATIAAVERGAVRLALGDARRHPPEPRTVLLAALIRPNRFEWLIEKATELGASVIQPVITERCAVRPGEIGASRLERWRRIATEAAEQSGRTVLPDVRRPAPLVEALADAEGTVLVAAEPAHGPAPSLGLVARLVGDGPVTVLTGPEGGLTTQELEDATQAGARPVALGPLVLRAETAAVAALAILVDARASAYAPEHEPPQALR